MPLEDFIIRVYVLIDDWLKDYPVTPRQAGYAPALSDAGYYSGNRGRIFRTR